MCLAIPSKIVDIKEGWATVRSDKHNHRANLSLVKDVKVGDYVLVHGDMVLNKVEKEEAEKILKMVNNNYYEK
ncbi:HypC/HybG/HupF family hydrogenase formation chaperone [Patescibacteria group bacterium]|nr:HypC/HybG/HupF family hydrogenase formation chaperone [Patescibacteria group bacterium]